MNLSIFSLTDWWWFYAW